MISKIEALQNKSHHVYNTLRGIDMKDYTCLVCTTPVRSKILGFKAIAKYGKAINSRFISMWQ